MVFTFFYFFLSILYFYLSKIKTDSIEIKIKKNQDFFLFLGLFFFLILINFKHLSFSIYVDELVYAQNSIRPSLGFFFIFCNFLDLKVCSEWPLKTLVFIFNFLSTAFLIYIFLKCLNNISLKIFLFLSLVAIISRIFSENYALHVPLHGLIPLIFVSFAGLSSLVIKLACLFTFCIFIFFIFKQINSFSNITTSLLASLIIATIPNLIWVSTYNTNELWTIYCTSFVYIYFAFRDRYDYVLLIGIISIFCLFRQTSVFILIPVLIIWFLDSKNYKNLFQFKKKIKIFTNIFVPTLIFLPFFFRDFVLGRPATSLSLTSESFFYILEKKFNILFQTNFFLIQVLNIFSIWYLFFIIFIFFITSLKKFLIIFFIFFCHFLLSYIFLDFDYWNYPKYTNELVTPMVVVSILLFLYKFKEIFKTKFRHFFLLLLISLNLFSFFSYNYKKNDLSTNYTKIKDQNNIMNSDTRVLLKFYYKFDQIFNYMRSYKINNSTLILGKSENYFLTIINKYSFNEVSNYIDKEKEIFKFIDNINVKTFDKKLFAKEIVKLLNENIKINYVLLVDIYNRELIEKELKVNNWKKIELFENDLFYSTSVLYKKVN